MSRAGAAAPPHSFAAGVHRGAASGLGLVRFFAWAALITLFGVSHLMLAKLGVAYETSGGAAWQKIAPSTYLIFLAIAALIAARPDLVALLDDIVRRHKGMLALFAAWAMLFVFVVRVQGGPLTATFDTFLAPMAFALIIARMGETTQRRMALFLHAFMAANAFIGIAEFALGFRITPIVADGQVITTDYRSSALLGHPLNNAAMSACYAIILMLGGGRDLRPRWRTLAVLVQVLALAAFGGRFATVAFVAFAGVIAAHGLVQILAGRRFSRGAAAAALALTPALVLGVFLLVSEGFLDKFLMRFVQDDGSAASRVVMFELIGQIPFHELLVGPSLDEVSTLMKVNGIAFGIESFWVGFIAYYGILISVPLFAGFIAFLFDLKRATIRHSGWAILLFVLIVSTSVSLSGKTTSFAQFAAMLLLLMRPPATASAPSRPAATV